MSAATKQNPVKVSVPEGKKSIHDTLDCGYYHLDLGLSPEVNGVVEQLALRYRSDKAEVINRALGLLKYLADATDEGKRVGIASPDQELEVELTDL